MSSEEDGGVLQNVRHVAVDDALGQTFGNRRLADAGIADEQRVVLLPAAQDLNRALDFLVAPDQRVDLAVFGLEVEVDAVGFQRLVLLAALPFGLGLLVLGPARRAGFARPGALGDAMGDVVDRVVAGHLLLLQEVGRVAFAFGEDGDQNVGAGHLVAPGGLHVDDGTLDDALEAGGRLGVFAVVGDEIDQFVVDIVGHSLAQRGDIDTARLHHAHRIFIIHQRQKQMLQRGIFMVTFVGAGKRAVQGFFETTGEGWQRLVSLLFHDALQRMLVLAGEIHDLGHFGFGHLVGVDAALPHAILVDMEHDAGGFLAVLAEEALQNEHDELHRRVVVVQKKHPVKIRPFDLGLGAGDDRRALPVPAPSSPPPSSAADRMGDMAGERGHGPIPRSSRKRTGTDDVGMVGVTMVSNHTHGRWWSTLAVPSRPFIGRHR